MKKTFFLFSVLFLFTIITFAQNTILPFTGTKIFSNGLQAPRVEITVDGYVLTDNKFPAGREIAIRMPAAKGFVADGRKYIYPAAEIVMKNNKGIILATVKDYFQQTASTGISGTDSKDFIIKAIPAASNGEVNLEINITDRRSKNSMKMIIPLIITNLPLAAVASAGVATQDGEGMEIKYTNNLKIKEVIIEKDDNIRVNTAMSYSSVDLQQIAGAEMADVLAGTEQYWVYDATTLEDVLRTDKLLKRVGGSSEGVVSSYLLKIPTNLKTDKKKYIVRFRWVSKENKRIIDAVIHM